MKGADIFDYIDQNVKDGVEGLNVHGVPKSGKSNLVRRINKDCMIRHNENLIMPGTVNCEWRNLLYHKQKPVEDFTVLLPEDFKEYLHFHNIPYDVEKHFKYIDYEKDLIIEDYLKGKKRNLLVIYDNHYRDLLFYKRIEIWNEIAKQLIDRTFLLEKPIGLTFDEAGVYFPQIALDDHYRQVYRFVHLVVDFRKNNVRLINISQIDSEIINTIREKQYWVILKKGLYNKKYAKAVRKATPFYAVNQYTILEGGIYTNSNVIIKMEEADKMFKIIPIKDYELEEVEPKNKRDNKLLISRNNAIKELAESSDKEFSKKRLAELFNLSDRQIDRILA